MSGDTSKEDKDFEKMLNNVTALISARPQPDISTTTHNSALEHQEGCHDEQQQQNNSEEDHKHNRQTDATSRKNRGVAFISSLFRETPTQDARSSFSDEKYTKSNSPPKYEVRELVLLESYYYFVVYRQFYSDEQALAWLDGGGRELKAGDRGNLSVGGFCGPFQITTIHTGFLGDDQYVLDRLNRGEITHKSWTSTVKRLSSDEDESSSPVDEEEKPMHEDDMNTATSCDSDGSCDELEKLSIAPDEKNDTYSDQQLTGAAENTQRYRWKEDARGRRLTFACIACYQPAFRSSDVRRADVFVNHHAVVGSSWRSAAAVWPYPFVEACHTIMFGLGWIITHKLCCACCGRNWGIIARNKLGVELPYIKINSFAIFDENGFRYLCDTWKKVPWEFPMLTLEELADYYLNMQVSEYKSCHEGAGVITCLETTCTVRDVTVYVPEGAVDAGQRINFIVDTTAQPSYLTTMLSIKRLQERLVTTGVQFNYPDYNTPRQVILKKNACVIINHMARDQEQLVVRVARSRESVMFYDVEKYDGTQEQEAYYTCDGSRVCVYTNELNHIICTETATATPEENRGLSDVEMMLVVFVTDLNHRRDGEVYVVAYNRATAQPKHVENFKNTMSRGGFNLQIEKVVTLPDDASLDDVIEIISVRSSEKWDWTDAQQQQQQCCCTPIRDVFFVHESGEPCCMVEAPQQIAYYRVTTVRAQQQRIELDLQVMLQNHNTGASLLLDTVNICTSVATNVCATTEPV